MNASRRREWISQCLRSRRTFFRSAMKNTSRCRVCILVPRVTEDLLQVRDQERVAAQRVDIPVPPVTEDLLQERDQEHFAAQSGYPGASGHGGPSSGPRSRTRRGAEWISRCLRSRRTFFRSAIENASRRRVDIPVPPVTEDLLQERDQERVATQSGYPGASGHGGASSGARS